MTFGKEIICAAWYDDINFGDALNPVIIKHLSGHDPTLITKYTLNIRNFPIYIVIGSILDMSLLQEKKILKNAVIWGAGFINESGRLFGVPRKICAVRGPLTRNIIQKQGIQCPEIFGDPALLLPCIYKPEKNQRYSLGIIPHLVDKNHNLLKRFKDEPHIKIINLDDPINDVIDQICCCKRIASSSLHGIIVADAYGIPSIWIKFSDNIHGQGFKFKDYFGSVHRIDTEPLIITEKTTVDIINGYFYNYKIDIDLTKLLEACPFYNNK
jgi:pyruvyltransferase